MNEKRLWIGNEWLSAASKKTYVEINPATGEEIAAVPLGGKEDVDLAVQKAKEAFPIWSKKSQAERSEVVCQIASVIKENAKELGQIECMEHGTPIASAVGMMIGSAKNLEFAAHAARSLIGDVIPIKPGLFHYQKNEPIGVCALIIPWNAVMPMLTTKMGPALSVGNTCIIKPPSIDSLTTLKLAELLQKTDLPPGTVNMITGPGHVVGEALTDHPEVDLISFTGSSETGKELMARASRSVKRLTLELGGKNPFIVLQDADLEVTAQRAAMCLCANSGQICASPGRFYIHESQYDEFVGHFVTAAKKVIVGDPTDPMTQMGPLVSQQHRDHVEAYIRAGLEEGATLVLGGERPTDPPFNRGFYVMPTVLTGVTQHMKIAREEIFGPVGCMMKYSSEDEVIEMANDNIFGLSASVWTRDVLKAMRFADELKAGTVWINDHLTIFPEFPWGGVKESGIGKESGLDGLKDFIEKKMVAVNLNESLHRPRMSGC